MDQSDLYVIAGTDLRDFVAAWVSDLESGGGHARGLLEHAHTDPAVRDRYECGAHYMFANIGPARLRPRR